MISSLVNSDTPYLLFIIHCFCCPWPASPYYMKKNLTHLIFDQLDTRYDIIKSHNTIILPNPPTLNKFISHRRHITNTQHHTHFITHKKHSTNNLTLSTTFPSSLTTDTPLNTYYLTLNTTFPSSLTANTPLKSHHLTLNTTLVSSLIVNTLQYNTHHTHHTEHSSLIVNTLQYNTHHTHHS